jgi:hypothetical protein
MDTHERDVQVNVDIRAARERFPGLKGKASEIDVKGIMEKTVPLASGQEAK